MSEDGMLLNLAMDTGPAPTKKLSANKGGRWKDRVRAKRAAAAREKPKKSDDSVKTASKPSSSKEGHPKKASSEKKRKREPGALPSEPSRKLKVRSTDRDKAKDGTETFVSSLFTYNPDQELADEKKSEEVSEVHDPSNAPLADSTSFTGLKVNDRLSNLLRTKMQLEKPTRIQRAVVPRLIEQDRDLFVQAQTGSGKTLSYVLPILARLMTVENLHRESGLYAVILAPTRELSNQIYAVLESLVRCCHWIVPGIVIGGEKKKAEKARLRKGVNILVATPGRLADHFNNTSALDLSRVRWVVLDEGDRLMDLGFEETITTILQIIEERSLIHRDKAPGLPSRRVNILCSATMKGKVERLGEVSLNNADWVTPDTVPEVNESFDDTHTVQHLAPAQLIQDYTIAPAKLRLVTLASILLNLAKTSPDSRVMVFFSCSDSVEFHFSAFTRDGEDPNDADKENQDPTVKTSPLLGDGAVIYKLHGSLNQQTRTSTLAAFSGNKTGYQGKPSILFCTDVASRGLDLPLITNVVEYDPPFAQEDHVHRIGRTARAGQKGSSIIFLLPGKEEGYVDLLKSHHPHGIHYRSHKDLIQKAFGKNWETDATTWHLDVERWLLEDDTAAAKSRKAFTSHIRAYATHLSSERSIFDMKAIHLGHIAKSFGLRETPGKFKTGTSKKKPSGDSSSAPMDPRKKMLMLAQKNVSSNASEFNIG
ncbi:hypothetical protein TRICI_003701 [Trichomonascus ciferrii]|uniref:ATP-dependent RNA helicase n=1 Tax=Trichomonascus ciferrii TaxID=44093 RepID=A0A642V998_9ASCO|nr:hypothetical protein TRICI_003701 [Trichomonascus ciferrii]